MNLDKLIRLSGIWFIGQARSQDGSPPLYRLSYKVRREQAVGSEDVKVTAMNMYKYKERLRLYKRWPCSTYILNRVN